jgi:hypothetical protein
MPRNVSGTYSLPAGNPVVAGTTIDASWANDTMNDLANEITNSLSRTGAGGMLAPFRLFDGSVSAPGLAFLNETNSGWYRTGAGNVRLSVLGVNVLQATSTSMLVPAGITFQALGNASVAGTLSVTGALTLTAGMGAALDMNGYKVTDLGTPTAAADATTKAYVDAAISAASGTASRATYTATAAQTTFAIAYQVGAVDVYLNGAKQLAGSDFTAANGTTVVFTVPLTAGDIVDLVGYGMFVPSAFLPLAGGTMTGTIAFAAGQTMRRNVQVVGTNAAAVAGQNYVLTASLTLTLPASPTVGDTVGISNLSGTTSCVVARNGSNIQALAEDLTLDTINAALTLMYADATRGWVFV